MSTRAIPTVRRSLKRMQDFLLHCASISTKIGEWFRIVIAFPPMIKDKEPFLLVADGAFAFLPTIGSFFFFDAIAIKELNWANDLAALN